MTGGEGEVVVDGEVRAGDSVHIAPIQLHTARAVTELHMVEVQVGWPLAQEDIERFGFFWEAG